MSHPHSRSSRSPGGRTQKLLAVTLILVALATLASGCGPKAQAEPPDISRPTLTAAATALDKRDAAAFAATLSTPLRLALEGQLDLAGAGPAKLARVLREAKLVGEYDQVRWYEATIDQRTYSFVAVKEGNAWLLAGL